MQSCVTLRYVDWSRPRHFGSYGEIGAWSGYPVSMTQVLYRASPAFLRTVNAVDMPDSSMVGHELGNKIKEFQHYCFHITLSLIAGIKTEWPFYIVCYLFTVLLVLSSL